MLRMTDIAAKAGVSQSTVSFVLNGRHTAIRISEETRLKVLAAAEELGYRNNRIARAVRTGNTRMLGIVGGDLGMEHVGAMLGGAIEEANRHNYTLKPLPQAATSNTREIVRWSSEWRLSGVIALHLPATLLDAIHEESQSYGYPLLLLDTGTQFGDIPQVASDDASGVEAAIAHLVELGHRKIAFISGETISTISSLRESLFHSAMKKRGLDVPRGYVVNGDYTFRESSEKAARSLLSLPAEKRPTAIFCGGDRIAAFTIQVAAELGLSVPDDISVVGFANLSIADLLNPRLTTIEQPFRKMGQVAVQRLLEIVEPAKEGAAEEVAGDGVPALSSRREGPIQLLETKLIVRDSTGAVRVKK